MVCLVRIVQCAVSPDFYIDEALLLTASLRDWTKHWIWSEGVYMPGWMKYQIFIPLALLQGLNLFWYTLMFKILVRCVFRSNVGMFCWNIIVHSAIITRDVDDQRSDDEDEGDDDTYDEKED